MLSAFITAIKYNEDRVINNSFIAKIGGVSTLELNIIETSFLELLDYRLFVETKDYEECESYIIEELLSFNDNNINSNNECNDQCCRDICIDSNDNNVNKENINNEMIL